MLKAKEIRSLQPTNRKWCFRNLNKNVSNDKIDIRADLYTYPKKSGNRTGMTVWVWM